MFLFLSLLAVSLSKLPTKQALCLFLPSPEAGHGQCLECSLENKMFLEPLMQVFRIESEL